MKYRFWIWLVVGGLPLLIYPFILMANIMSIAGHRSTPPPPILQQLAAHAFLWGSTLYPIVYLGFASAAIAASRRGKSDKAVNMSLLPLVYLILVVAAACAWVATSS